MTLPASEQALSMPTEELAGYLVLHHKNMNAFHVHNVMCEIDSSTMNQGPQNRQTIAQYKEALAEAYGWAFTEGLFIIYPNDVNGGWWKVSRRGRQLQDPVDVLELSDRDILPKAFLHPMIAEHAAPIFKLGKYDAAVLQAFKQVEIAVKQASNVGEVGAKLMRTAFNPNSGVLNTLQEPSEKEGLMFVFTGAIQLFRNSTGHNNIVLAPQEAAHLLIHASYLLTLVEKHSRAANP